jgi:hypothetical protein
MNHACSFFIKRDLKIKIICEKYEVKDMVNKKNSYQIFLATTTLILLLSLVPLFASAAPENFISSERAQELLGENVQNGKMTLIWRDINSNDLYTGTVTLNGNKATALSKTRIRTESPTYSGIGTYYFINDPETKKIKTILIKDDGTFIQDYVFSETTDQKDSWDYDSKDNPYIVWTGIGNKQINIAKVDLKEVSPGSHWVTGLSNKITLPETTSESPQIAFVDGSMYITWPGMDHRINILWSKDNGATYKKFTSSEMSSTKPKLYTDKNNLRIRWTGYGNDQINFANVTFYNKEIIGLTDKVTLSDTTEKETMMLQKDGRDFLVWTGKGNDQINIMDVTDFKNPNIYYPGIAWGKNEMTENIIRSESLNAKLTLSYYDSAFVSDPKNQFTKEWVKSLFNGAFQVWLAYKKVPTEQNYLTVHEKSKYTIAFGHSGGTRTLISKLESGDIQADYVVLAAPMMISQSELENLIKTDKAKKIIVYQSTDDLFYQHPITMHVAMPEKKSDANTELVIGTTIPDSTANSGTSPKPDKPDIYLTSPQLSNFFIDTLGAYVSRLFEPDTTTYQTAMEEAVITDEVKDYYPDSAADHEEQTPTPLLFQNYTDNNGEKRIIVIIRSLAQMDKEVAKKGDAHNGIREEMVRDFSERNYPFDGNIK